MYLYDQEYIVGSNILTATATILVWEILTTLDDEINYIWKQPWTLGTFLFWANRYLPFFDTFIALRIQFSSNMSTSACFNYYRGITWMMATGLILAEFVIILRTWAIWRHKRAVRIFLCTLSFCVFFPLIATLVVEVHSFGFELPPPDGFGCRLVTSKRLIVVPYCLIALSETAVVILTLARGVDHLSFSSHSSWVARVYGYGLLFYIYLLVITMINIVVPLVSKQSHFKGYLAISQHVFHSIFCSRVIIFIQRQRWTRRSAATSRCDDEDGGDSGLYTTHNAPLTNQASNATESAGDGQFVRHSSRDRKGRSEGAEGEDGGDEDIELTAYRTNGSTHTKDWTQ
ncbi:hypothetical protein BDN70DRAFT_882814 [Pholiota conissans]|uniref:DUF6533 domain-containing protein n=1 Tax=Pholiota conissans TaxID=109636 RepID=A0A9P5YVW8_9AGAR|nr:hypothetical protein BDN70DRAFT_882814 [Pholiota conissans]